MKSLSAKQLFLSFLAFWILFNVIQASFTELDPDEAYYWMYSQDLDWGYFDHPGGVALCIKIGTSLLGDTTLGVRLLPILLMTASFYLLWILAGKPEKKEDTILLISLLVAMPMLNVYSFISTPDAPLLFFGTLYLYLYKRFIQDTSILNTILLGVCMAALLHSKYHGVLWIFFIFLANWKLVLNPKFYLASIIGLLLFMPHLYWQYSNDFPSFRYHLSGRDDIYEFKYTVTYLMNQLVIFSPLLIPFIVKSLYQYTAKDVFEKAWKFLILGFWVLFLFLTGKGHAEPQWTALLSLVIVLILYNSVDDGVLSRKWVQRMAITSFILVILGRIFLLIPFKNLDSDFHKRIWAQELKEDANGLPILFMDSYRDPSKYSFYAKERAYTLTDVYYRKNQYDLWDHEAVLHNQQVYIVGQGNLKCRDCRPLQLTNRGQKTYLIADDFQVSQNVWIDWEWGADSLDRAKDYSIELSLENPYLHDIDPSKGSLPLSLQVILIDWKEHKHWVPIEFARGIWPAKNSSLIRGSFNIPNDFPIDGECSMQVGIRTGDLFPSVNSKAYKVVLKK